MRQPRTPPLLALLIALIVSLPSLAQTPPPSPDVPTFHSTSTLVFLDVTVLDKKGRPVVKGLSKNDFTITEDKKPQRIFSFEVPESHSIRLPAGDENPDGKAPIAIFVLDLLNSSFEDFAFIRDSMQRYLAAQPSRLNAPAELMVIGNQSLELLQGFTRSRDDLQFAIRHLPPALPYKEMNSSFFAERFTQSIQALQEIALQNKGIPGRKNIIWVGHGGPGLNTAALDPHTTEKLEQYIHGTANMLVDARISLFVIYPGLKVENRPPSISATSADASLGNNDPFAGDINFGVFVNETGGDLFYNRNDVDALIQRSQQLGSEYYTLTYQPPGGDENGRFRRIRVSLRDPNLQVVTKAGYFAPDSKMPIDPRQQTISNLSAAALSSIPFTGLNVKISHVVRHPDTHTAEITVQLQSKSFTWQSTDDGKSRTKVILAAVSLSSHHDILASRLESLSILVGTQDPSRLAQDILPATFTLRVPAKARSIRVAIETEEGGQIGAADMDRAAIDAAPATPSPEPQIVPRPNAEPTSLAPSAP